MTEYRTGDSVFAPREFTGYPDGSYTGRLVPAGTDGRVTSVRSANRVRVKFHGLNRIVTVNTDYIQPLEESTQAKRKADEEEKRKLTEPQEGDILPDDPRLTWLWRKAAQHAEVKRHCGEYDAICDALGIPGRERDFAVNVRINGITFTATILATSKKDADKKLVASIPLQEGSTIEVFDRNTGGYTPILAA